MLNYPIQSCWTIRYNHEHIHSYTSMLQLASMSKKGIAASTLWSKCLVSNTFSLWFIHLQAFIQVSHEPHCAMRAACAVLKKMQEYRLHTADEVSKRIFAVYSVTEIETWSALFSLQIHSASYTVVYDLFTSIPYHCDDQLFILYFCCASSFILRIKYHILAIWVAW